MEKITVEELEEIIGQYHFSKDCSMPHAGLCRPEDREIRYNPLEIDSKREFYLTLLHEIVHAVDAYSDLTEDEIEQIAEESYRDKELLSYLKKQFPYQRCCNRQRCF